MSVTIYTFQSKQHYEDYIFKLHYETYRRQVTQPDGSVKHYDIEKPLGVMVRLNDILELDWHAIKLLVKQRFNITVAECPLCFWSGGKFCWLKPIFIAKTKLPHYKPEHSLPNFVKERLAVCLCRIWDIDWISHRDSRGKRTLNWDLVNDHFKHLNINWKDWLKRLESGEIIRGDDGNGRALAPQEERRQLADVF